MTKKNFYIKLGENTYLKTYKIVSNGIIATGTSSKLEECVNWTDKVQAEYIAGEINNSEVISA